MPGFFQFSDIEDGRKQSPESPFHRYGYARNPFPDSGVKTPVLYQSHMSNELQRLDKWLTGVGEATCGANLMRPDAIAPIAMSGALGVGKTHMLEQLTEGLRQTRDHEFRALMTDLTDHSASRLVLSGLLRGFMQNLKSNAAPHGSALPLLRKIVSEHDTDDLRGAIRSTFDDNSVLAQPLQKVLGKPDQAKRIEWLSKWITRSYVTQSQMGKLGLSGKIKPHGQSIRAIAELALLGWKTDEIDCLYILIDQLEELFRPDVVTDTRRARFLTDLRRLVDFSLEGYPIAVMLAWNTSVGEASTRADKDDETAESIEHSYRALWQRLGPPVNLPGLRAQDIWPFAETYLDHADNRPQTALTDKQAARVEFREQLKSRRGEVLERTKNERQANVSRDRYTSRAVLKNWRDLAHEVAK